jgi:diguanylate cyclase (GGDEF)-like protein
VKSLGFVENDAERQIESLCRANVQLNEQVARLKRDVAQARHFAYHDPLTGLPNRSLLHDRLEQAVAQAARVQKLVALLLLDVDGFKQVNDRFGHATGDELLRKIAGRLRACIRRGDTACRYGGDEFVVMLPEIDTSEVADHIAQKISACLATPYAIDGAIIAVTVSVGISIYRDSAQPCVELIKQADAAMYHAKLHRKTQSLSA